MTVSGESPQLDYAPRPASARRARLYRWAIAATILFAAYFCRTWPIETWRHFRLVYLQRQCVSHPIPAGAVVYSSNAPAITFLSPQWAAFAAEDPTNFAWTGNKITATVFVGELRASNGLRRLIEVEAHPNYKPNSFSDVMFCTRSVALGVATTFQETAQPGGGPTCNADPRWQRTLPDIVVTAATVDSTDPSHICFNCRLFQVSYLVDGYLHNDGSVTLDKWTPTLLPLPSSPPR
jgi:hypothetical protein